MSPKKNHDMCGNSSEESPSLKRPAEIACKQFLTLLLREKYFIDIKHEKIFFQDH
jgi:hypothetical protein